MNYFEIVLVLVIVGLSFWVWKLRQDREEREKEVVLLEKEKDEYAEFGKGLAEYNQKVQEKKNRAKERILQMLSKQPKVGVREAAKELKVSTATARRYFDELEDEGAAKQVGKTGKNVYYSKT